MRKDTWILDYYEANGFEKTLFEIIKNLPSSNKWCVEFGAWDGLNGSNSRDLIVENGFSSVLIEGMKERFIELEKNYQSYPNVHTFNDYVHFEGSNTLDAILSRTDAPKDIDLVSIDIDGNDYHVWKSLKQYEPKVICIEFNSSIPPEVDFVQEAKMDVNHGNSIKSLVELGKSKGYELISVISVNAIFVKKEYFPLYEIADNSVHNLWTNRNRVSYIFTGYDGHVFIRGNQKISWQDLPMRESKMQVIPGFLQKWPFKPWRRRFYLIFINPRMLLRKIKNKSSKKA